MTVRRTLGSGPQSAAQGIRAAEADLLADLPALHLPDLVELRARGVLGTRVEPVPGRRRTLGPGVS